MKRIIKNKKGTHSIWETIIWIILGLIVMGLILNGIMKILPKA